ncbi:MAG: MarR family transcriptional regulator [Parvularculaceae bacterium]|nr:MarR family transcriptional regulator [Parvularculaceae bacterium]
MSSRTALRSEAGPALSLSWDEIGYFSNALASARRQFSVVTDKISEEFALGPRGPWIVARIGKGQSSPQELARLFEIRPSLMTSELSRLVEAGLIRQRKSAEDGRRVDLTLTARGERVRRRLGEEMEALVHGRLSGFSREEVLLCARLLEAFSTPARD